MKRRRRKRVKKIVIIYVPKPQSMRSFFFSFLCCNKGLFLYHVMNGSGFRYRDKNIAHKDTFFTWEWAGLGFGPETKNSSNRHFLSPLWAHPGFDPETKQTKKTQIDSFHTCGGIWVSVQRQKIPFSRVARI